MVFMLSNAVTKEDFMKYLNDWEKSVEQREGYSKTEKGTIYILESASKRRA